MTNRTGAHGIFGQLVRASILLLSFVMGMVNAAAARAASLETLDSMDIPHEGVDGVRIEELSGLAWDEDEQLLYAVSDGGLLHHFRLRLDGTRIAEIQPVFSTRLVSQTSVTNAEGLAILNAENGQRSDSELLIAFEDGPSIARFTPGGEWIVDTVLPTALADETQYAKMNRRLEAVTLVGTDSTLTAPERPLLGQPEERHTLYTAEMTWSFEAYQPDSRLKAIETLPDGNLLVLERTREEKDGTLTARLRYLDFAGCSPNRECRLAELSAEPDTMLVDNFEGMARLTDGLFLIVTDKAGTPAEPTTFVLFRFMEAP